MEIELNLIDETFDPAMANQTVLERIDDPASRLSLAST